jgi:hypothetical protein
MGHTFENGNCRIRCFITWLLTKPAQKVSLNSALLLSESVWLLPRAEPWVNYNLNVSYHLDGR